MAKTATVRARIEPDLKEEVDLIIDSMGVNWTQVITMLAKQLRTEKKLPFKVKAPNAKTKQAIEDSIKGRNLTKFNSKEELFASWD